MNRAVLILFFALVSTWQYWNESLSQCPACTETMQEIIDGTYGAPFVYRPLTPAVLVALGNTFFVMLAFHFVMLLAFFTLLWSWSERWRGSGLASVGIATVALTVMYPTYYFSVYTVTEWVLWLVGLHLLTQKPRPVLYGALVALAATNREMTAVLLVTSWLAMRPRQWRVGLVYGGVAASVYGAIRLLVGPSPDPYSVAWVFELNTTTWRGVDAAKYLTLLSPLLFALAASLRRTTPELRRLAVGVMVVYYPLWFALAIWQETRLLMPVLILLAPAITHRQPTPLSVAESVAPRDATPEPYAGYPERSHGAAGR